MITIEIPGRAPLAIRSLVLDYNGTIARDGILLEEVLPRVAKLREMLDIYVLTADTYGTVAQQCAVMGIAVQTFPREDAAVCKEKIVRELQGGVFAVGNGFNDILMFDAADLSVAVLKREGLCASLLLHADVLVTSPADALDLLLFPDRLRATLRS